MVAVWFIMGALVAAILWNTPMDPANQDTAQPLRHPVTRMQKLQSAGITVLLWPVRLACHIEVLSKPSGDK